MKRSVFLVSAVVLGLLVAAQLRAQPPAAAPASDLPQTVPTGAIPYPGTAPMPPALPAPGVAVVNPPPQPPASAGSTPADGECCKVKICVLEQKEQKKTVYSMRCKEFCLKRCHFHCLAWLLGRDCDCDCCEMRTRRVLVKKSVPDCPKTECVVKEVPAGAPCAPCPPLSAQPPK